MASPIPARSDVSGCVYECVNCGQQMDVESIQAMPPCPTCNGPRMWEFRSEGHSEDDDPDD